MQFKTEIIQLLAAESGLEQSLLASLMQSAAAAGMGDLALPCFRLAKVLRKAPAQIAADLKEKIAGRLPWLERVDVVGGYLNFFFDPAQYATAVLQQCLAADYCPGSGDEGAAKTVLVEYSSPNIAKPFHVGHAFSTLLGETIANLYQHRGYEVSGSITWATTEHNSAS